MTDTQRPLRALELLAAAGIDGTDATTAVDTLIVRLVDLACRQVDGLTPRARHDHLVGKVGSDAIRALSTLAAAAEIRSGLAAAGVAGADLDDAVLGTLRLARSTQIGTHEAIDTTVESIRRFRLEGDA